MTWGLRSGERLMGRGWRTVAEASLGSPDGQVREVVFPAVAGGE
ncbi:hypothetical protein [Frankia sp. Cj5]|nr:hypothetical protein [Frankia sp. Cj5]